MPIQEQLISIDGHRVWTRRVGETSRPDRLPIVLLHGGPGVPSDYLEPLELLAGDGREVIRYDQLGCGRSDHPDDSSFMRVERFVAELAQVTQALNLTRFHLYGQSWGGMLALEAALSAVPGVVSLVLSNAPGSMPLWVAETGRLRRELPVEVQKILDTHELAGTTDSPDYQEALMVFYKRHVCRLDPWPDCLFRSFTAMEQDPRVYQAMCGTSEFNITGTLMHWDVSSRLGEIRQPTLVIGGEYDEATPTITTALHRGIPHSQFVLFENASHLTHLEQPDAYLSLVSRFLTKVDSAARLG